METDVNTEQGKVRGTVARARRKFLGIPYAAPPVGEGRFAPPQPPQRWEGTRDALDYGATALQPRQEFTLIPEPLVQGGQLPQPQRVHPGPRQFGPARSGVDPRRGVLLRLQRQPLVSG